MSIKQNFLWAKFKFVDWLSATITGIFGLSKKPQSIFPKKFLKLDQRQSPRIILSKEIHNKAQDTKNEGLRQQEVCGENFWRVFWAQS